MATLIIKKISDKVWKHTPSDGLAYIVSRLYIKSSGDKVRVVEFNGAIRSEHDYSDVIVYNVGGGAETFTSVQELFERLEQLGYIGFFNEGGGTPFNPSDYDLAEFTNLDTDRFARLSDIPIQSINAGTNITINNTDPKNPIINATGGLTDAPSNGSTYGRKNGNWEVITGGETKSFICHWQINQSIPASASWWRQDPQVGIRGNFTTNSSLTPTNAFANNTVLSPAFTLPFQAKIKSVTVYGWSNQGATNVRFCVNSSKISSVGGITTPIDCLLLADFLVNTKNIQVNGFRHEQTTDLNTATLPALQEIRLFFNNNNVGSNVFDGIVTVEFEKIS